MKLFTFKMLNVQRMLVSALKYVSCSSNLKLYEQNSCHDKTNEMGFTYSKKKYTFIHKCKIISNGG